MVFIVGGQHFKDFLFNEKELDDVSCHKIHGLVVLVSFLSLDSHNLVCVTVFSVSNCVLFLVL